MYDSIIEILKNGFTELVNNVMSVVTAIIPIGLGIFGLGFIVSKAKHLFEMVTFDDEAAYRMFDYDHGLYSEDYDYDPDADY